MPETQPASEFLNGQITQKPMPQGEHSVLQGTLISQINAIATAEKLAYGFPELRCTFGGAAIIPDVSVFRWSRIPRTPTGRVANQFESYPDWAIEILSPNQSQTKVLANLLHCAEHATELGWLIDPASDSVLCVFPESRVKLYQGSQALPVLSGLSLNLSAADIFGWLILPE
ncbi:MAG: Uma2 family endonuclease [Cyanothece sp. SIO2G6]|nr:Uma2 family endonuclease [Cyanothece sp. SIO2G6]